MSYLRSFAPVVLVLTMVGGAPASDKQARRPAGEKAAPPRVLRIGAVAYAPSALTVFQNLRRYFAKHDLPIDYVLYSNYDALVEALRKGHVDIAWNTPLAHARYHLLCNGHSQTLAMRDVDCNFRCKLLVRKASGIQSAAGLQGKTLALGSREAAEATVLPLHYLQKEGVTLEKVKLLRLDEEVDLRGNPCSSPLHVLKALRAGRADAGIVGERLWNDLVSRKAAEVEGLQAVWTSPSFSHCVFTAAKDFDKSVAARFRRLMLAMDGKDACTAEILRLEGASKWVAGSSNGFETLIDALRAERGKRTKSAGQGGQLGR
ncbi:MAG TPA: PhnD/SsuA/transferrin family substrate-binding protein [Gemmataceae bacterium]|nr:PhnD/SsuA/transferrin family substrate-binding protein [Gemmataceae bacterium]